MASIGSIAKSGMETSMIDLEEISNNIANANTIGFKKSLVNFSDIHSRGLGETRSNGLGVKVMSVSQDFSPGNLESTSRQLDLSIVNDGFFVLSNPTTGQSSYSRAGRFELDKDGYIIGPSGRVQGYDAQNGEIINSGQLVDMKIPNAPIPATSSSSTSLDLNLDSTQNIPVTSPFNNTDPSTYNYRSDTTLYDSLGNSHNMTVYYSKTSDNNWNTNILVDNAVPTSGGTGTLSFNSDGTFNSTTQADIVFSPGSGATAGQNVAMSFSGSTQFAGANQVRVNQSNGNASGAPVGFSLDNSGQINVFYSNGQSQINGQIAVAQFKSPQNLAKSDSMSWVSTLASGDAILDASSSNGAFTVGSVERANVDLTDELVKLIGAQHNFHANSQVQQTYSQILQAIENIR